MSLIQTIKQTYLKNDNNNKTLQQAQSQNIYNPYKQSNNQTSIFEKMQYLKK